MIPLSLLPLLCVIWFMHEKIQEIKLLDQQVATLEKKAVFQKKQKEKRDLVWERAQKLDSHYLEKTFDFLIPELKRVQVLCRQYPDNRALHDRLKFLQGEGNQIRWILSAEREESSFHEKEFKMETKVQMNDDDLRKFLVAVEGDDYSEEGVAKLLCPEKSMILRQFVSGSDADTIHLTRPTPLEVIGGLSEESGHKLPQKGDFSGQMSFATPSVEKEQPFLIVKEFDLSRERESSDEVVYNIQAEIIQRS